MLVIAQVEHRLFSVQQSRPHPYARDDPQWPRLVQRRVALRRTAKADQHALASQDRDSAPLKVSSKPHLSKIHWSRRTHRNTPPASHARPLESSLLSAVECNLRVAN